jgi:hypothetical protein
MKMAEMGAGLSQVLHKNIGVRKLQLPKRTDGKKHLIKPPVLFQINQ